MTAQQPASGLWTPVLAATTPESTYGCAPLSEAHRASRPKVAYKTSDGRVRLTDGRLMRAKRFRTELRKAYGFTERINTPVDAEIAAAVRQIMDMKGLTRPLAAQHLMRMGAR